MLFGQDPFFAVLGFYSFFIYDEWDKCINFFLRVPCIDHVTVTTMVLSMVSVTSIMETASVKVWWLAENVTRVLLVLLVFLDVKPVIAILKVRNNLMQ